MRTIKKSKKTTKVSVAQIKKVYNDLLDSGDLSLVFPTAVGDWLYDKETFVHYYKGNLEIQQAYEESTENEHLRDFRLDLDLDD